MSANPRSIEMIKKLCSFDTTSRNSNLDLIGYVQQYLEDHGVQSTLVHDETGAKANLFATIGPADKPGICLSGHTDVVPVDGQAWDTDPFSIVEKDGCLWGRGTSDMKSFVSVALTMTKDFVEADLKTPIHFAFSYDEEVGCIGVRRLIAQFDKMPVRPRGCIVGEPTEMKVITAHKGKLSHRCHVHGFECHSSLAPLGVNAVEYAAEIVSFLRRMGREIAVSGPFDEKYDVAHTTVHTGLMHGGTALNIVPKDCYFDFEFRHLPEDEPYELFARVTNFVDTELLPEMRKVNPDADIRFDIISQMPGLNMSDDHELTTFVKQLTGANSTSKVAFGTEAGLFQQADVPTIICGPGSIDQAHKPNEFIRLDQIEKCEKFLNLLKERLAA
ncbi:MAG: acetylornithine deacetylase [Rhodospirillales bacterium]